MVDALMVAAHHGIPARWFEARVISADIDTVQVCMRSCPVGRPLVLPLGAVRCVFVPKWCFGNLWLSYVKRADFCRRWSMFRNSYSNCLSILDLSRDYLCDWDKLFYRSCDKANV